MQFGVQVNVYRTSWEDVRASVEAMEAGDWDSVWFADHFIPPGANHEQEALTAFEGLAAIAAAAGMTKRLRGFTTPPRLISLITLPWRCRAACPRACPSACS